MVYEEQLRDYASLVEKSGAGHCLLKSSKSVHLPSLSCQSQLCMLYIVSRTRQHCMAACVATLHGTCTQLCRRECVEAVWIEQV